jgi:hypothetical protein
MADKLTVQCDEDDLLVGEYVEYDLDAPDEVDA